MFDNVWNDSASIISKATDLYDLFATDDVCFSDAEILSEVDRFTEDTTSILSTAWGFDLKWDQTRQVSHIKNRGFMKELGSHQIEFGEYLEIPNLDQLWSVVSHMDLPSLNQIYMYVQEALHFIGLDL
jgi:hypothetical protein